MVFFHLLGVCRLLFVMIVVAVNHMGGYAAVQ
jgi:hypothetical protein